MYTNGKLDTMRGIGKVLRSERGHREGGGRGGRGGSGSREEKCDKDFGARSGDGIDEKVIPEKFEIAKSRAVVLKFRHFFYRTHIGKESRYKM